MSRKTRHIRARRDEWVVVHRDRRTARSDSGNGWIIAAVVIGLFIIFL
jgi:hypothetical protein